MHSLLLLNRFEVLMIFRDGELFDIDRGSSKSEQTSLPPMINSPLTSSTSYSYNHISRCFMKVIYRAALGRLCKKRRFLLVL